MLALLAYHAGMLGALAHPWWEASEILARRQHAGDIRSRGYSFARKHRAPWWLAGLICKRVLGILTNSAFLSYV